MRRLTIALACASLLAGTSLAAAQATPAPADAAQPAAPAKPRAKKPAEPKPASSVTVTNASKHTATMVTISADEGTASTSKPLAPKKSVAVKLPKLKGCTVSVTAGFEGQGQADLGEFDVCKEKTIRFTD
jgi:hypothetical protein